MASTQTKVAVITGSAQGIGRAIALRLAADGFSIALNDLESHRSKLEAVAEEIKKTTGRDTVISIGDVSKETDVQALVDAAVNSLGGVDVMVANAGICPAIPFIDSKLIVRLLVFLVLIALKCSDCGRI